jgi:hypothetical protein
MSGTVERHPKLLSEVSCGAANTFFFELIGPRFITTTRLRYCSDHQTVLRKTVLRMNIFTPLRLHETPIVCIFEGFDILMFHSSQNRPVPQCIKTSHEAFHCLSQQCQISSQSYVALLSRYLEFNWVFSAKTDAPFTIVGDKSQS